MSAAALWGRLATQGFVAGDMLAGDGERAPWYVTAMVGTAAWIAAPMRGRSHPVGAPAGLSFYS